MNQYYEEHADNFFTSTVSVDMFPLYQQFLPLIPNGGSLLDAGCGSGRDAKYFMEQGYEVTAIDASKALAHLASKHVGIPVHQMHFDEIPWRNEFDAIWACASLLHVTRARLPSVMRKLLSSLTEAGVMYCSFKYGDSERDVGGRHFTDMNEELFRDLLSQCDHNKSIDIWITSDRRPGRENDKWLNGIISSGSRK